MHSKSIFLLMVGLTLCTESMAHIPNDGEGRGGNPHPSGHLGGGPIKPRDEGIPFPITADPTDYLLSSSLMSATAPLIRIQAVFWGAGWEKLDFADDRISGLDEFYSGYDLSDYSMVTREYFPKTLSAGEVGIGGRPIPRANYLGHVIDASSVPPLGTAGPNGKSGDFTVAVTEVCKELREHHIVMPAERALNYYPVYVEHARPSTEACQYHGFPSFGVAGCSGFASNPGRITFATALFYDVGRDKECDVNDGLTGHSKGLASLANLSARAIAAVQTDGSFVGWHDEKGNEIDDKCAWTFVDPFVTLSNGSIWKLQALWSNEAFLEGSGSANREGADGCVDGPIHRVNAGG